MLAATRSLRLLVILRPTRICAASAFTGLRPRGRAHSQIVRRSYASTADHTQGLRAVNSADRIPETSEEGDPAPRTLRLEGVNWEEGVGSREKIAEVFKGYGRIENIRIEGKHVYADFLTAQDAEYVLSEHQQEPFVLEGRQLSLSSAKPADAPLAEAQPMLRLVGVPIRGSAVRHALARFTTERWKIEVFRKDDDLTAPEVAYIQFRNPLDARKMHEFVTKKFPDAEVDLVDGIQESEAYPPGDTLVLVGFKGSKHELRRYLHDFRLDIRDVRRTRRDTEADIWEFVFVQFSSVGKAQKAKEALEKYAGDFRVRYSGV